MTIAQMRLTAIFVSLFYIPAFVFGVVSIWALIAPPLFAYLFQAELQGIRKKSRHYPEGKSKAYYSLNQILKLIYRFSIFLNLGVIVFIVSQAKLNLFAQPAGALDAKIFGSLAVFLDYQTDYDTLNIGEQIVIQIVFISLLISISLFIFCTKAAEAVYEDIIYQKIDERDNYVLPFSPYHWNHWLAIRFFGLAVFLGSLTLYLNFSTFMKEQSLFLAHSFYVFLVAASAATFFLSWASASVGFRKIAQTL